MAEGEVIAVGPGRVTDNGKRQSMDVKEGDRVLFAKYAGTEVKKSIDLRAHFDYSSPLSVNMSRNEQVAI